ncbi:hypothetical protein [Sodalis sp.]|uniref:hypothetical protein n=1 Tax=Sodalis sp. (in: enterobacteria) TaxID=1898979 RepID=UPI003873A97D
MFQSKFVIRAGHAGAIAKQISCWHKRQDLWMLHYPHLDILTQIEAKILTGEMQPLRMNVRRQIYIHRIQIAR